MPKWSRECLLFMCRQSNQMKRIKTIGQFSILIALAIIISTSSLKSIPIALSILLFGVFFQIYIYHLYKKEGKGGEFLKGKVGPLIVGVCLIIFFLVKDRFIR